MWLPLLRESRGSAPPRLARALVPLGLLVTLSVLLTSRAARASHTEVLLQYERASGAESCAAGDDLRAAVAARLGYDPFVASGDLDTIVVRIRRVGSGLEGMIERRDPSQQARGKPATITSKSGDCKELISALAVGIAIAIDPLSITRETPSPAASPLPSAPPAAFSAPRAPAPEDPPRVVVEAERGTPTQLQVGAGPSIAVGALPSASFGVRAMAGLSHGVFEIDIEGRFDPPVTVQAKGGFIDASLVLATLAPCLRYGLIIACTQVSLGALRGTGAGFDHMREDNTFYMAAGARAGLEFALGRRFAVRVLAEGAVPLTPTRLEADGVTAWSTPPFAFSAIPMLVGRFP